MFDTSYQCQFGKDPAICTCRTCQMKREQDKSTAALRIAEQRNIAPAGSTIPSVRVAAEPEAIRESSLEKIERQRLERAAESEKNWAFIQANESRYAAQRAEVLAKRQVPQVNPNHTYWPPYNPLAKEGEKELRIEYIQPITSLAVLSLEEAQELYNNMGGKETIGNVRSYGGLATDSAEAYTIAKGLGGLGVKSLTKNINGKDWIIIRDFSRHQQTLMKGNKWGASNPKVVKAGLGLNDLKGVVRYVRFNAGVEIAFAAGINAADYILRDEATLAELGVNMSADLAKGFISLAGAALFTAAMPATLGVLATGALFAVVSFAIGQGLDVLDKENEYSQDITKAVEEYFQ